MTDINGFVGVMKILTKLLQQFMSENQYPNIGNEPLLNNYQPPPPPPPPQQQNNPYNNPNPSFQQNPNPSFNNYPNPSFQNNPNPSFQQPYQQQPYQQAYRPGNAPYNQGYVVASVGNHQIVSNNNGVYYNAPPPGVPRVYAAGPMCLACRRQTSSMSRQVPGGVTWIWCFVLFILTGFCCCIPFCVDSCQDTEIVCANCQFVKSRIDANCC